MFAFDRDRISFTGALRFCGPDLKRLGGMLPDPEASNLVFNSPVLRTAEGGYRMIYLAENLAGEATGRHGLGYAESADGLVWTPRGELCFAGIPPEAVIRHTSVLPPSPEDPAWKLFGWAFDFKRGCIRYVCFEGEDGIRWRCLNFDRPGLVHPVDVLAGGKAGFEGLIARAVNSPAAQPCSREEMFRRRSSLSNDATATYRLPGGGFEVYSVWLADNPVGGPNYTPADNCAVAFRVIQRRVSADGMVWSPPEIVVPPDPEGPPQLQYYYLNGVTRADSRRFGMLGRYQCDRQIIEPELAVSRDGCCWERPYKQPWLRLEDEGEGAGLIHTSHHFVDEGDSWRLYYSVSRFFHNNRQLANPLPRRRGIYTVEVGKGRLLGISGSGIIETKPFIFTDREATLDADIRGTMRFELLDINGSPLPGRGLADSIPATGNSTRHELRWRDSEKNWICCDMASLRIEVDNGTFYRLSV